MAGPSCVTFTDELADNVLTLDVHVIVNVSDSDPPATTATGSVIETLPFVDRLVAHPSLEPPPDPTQLVAFVDAQVSVVEFPGFKTVGEALRDAVITGQVKTTDTSAD